MKTIALLLSLFTLASCAGSKPDRSPSQITLIRAGGFSGLEERFVIEESGRMQRIMQFPGREETVAMDTTIVRPDVPAIFGYLDRNIDSLRVISLNENGNLTTSLIITHNNQQHIIRWPNLEPPLLSTNKLDSLYQMVAPVQEWLSATQ